MNAGRDVLPQPFSDHQCLGVWEGGEGVSYRLASPDGDDLLLKVLHPGEMSVEAGLLISLRHPRVPALLREGRLDSGEPWLLRSWIPGESLSALMPLPPLAVLDLATQVLEILAYVHLRGLLHLDLKPANLLRDASGQYHLLDFGLGARRGARSQSGTPFFAAPEQWKGARVDRRSDLYALGMVLVAALDPRVQRRMPGGRPEGWEFEELRAWAGLAPDLPDSLVTLLRGLVSRRAQHRFFDAEEALGWLGQASGRPSPSLLEPDPALHPADRPMGQAKLEKHLAWSLQLPDVDAAELARLLREEGVETAEAVGQWLLERLSEGRIQARGTGWSYPDVLSGRVRRGDDGPGIQTLEDLRGVAARGRIRAAEKGFQRLLVEGVPEPQARRALAQGLLMAGEPARALPLLHGEDLPRLRALLDLGRIREAREGLDALPKAQQEPEEQAGRKRLEAAIAWLSGEAAEARALAEEAVGIERGPEEEILLARILAETGERVRGRALLEEAIRVLREGERPHLLAGALSNLGDLRRKDGDLAAAGACHAEALDLYQDLGHARYTALAQSNLGVVHKDAGRYDEALEAQRRARGLYEHVGDQRGAAIALANQGILLVELCQADQAEAKLLEARAELSGLGVHNLDERLEMEIQRARTLKTERRRPVPTNEQGEERMEHQDGEARDPVARDGVPREVFRSFVAINRKLANETDLERALHAVLDTALTLSGGRQGYLLLSGPSGIRSELRIGQGPGSKAYSRSIANRAIQEQRILEGSEALADRDLVSMPSVRRLEQRSVLCVPFLCASGQAGALYVEHPGRAGVFGDTEKEHLEVLADQAAIAVDRMLREEDLSAELSRSRRDLSRARQALGAGRPRRELLGESEAMEDLRREIQRLAPTTLPILIQGETGTGKELVAEALHREGQRSQGPFVTQNCAAIPIELAESLLFGHVKGAFTGALEDRAGLLELASGGTLFLDEVGELPLLLQAKLLRALQEGAVRRIGGEQEQAIDLRLLTATHRDLPRDIAEGGFREDLYYRIAAITLALPPLRERGSDALFLAEHFIEKLSAQEGRSLRLSEEAGRELLSHGWPGNVRELEHRMARAFLLCEGDVILSLGLGDEVVGREPAEQASSEGMVDAWPVTSLKDVESRTIRAVLEHTEGDKTRAAKILGISRTALYEKLKRMRSAD